LFKRNQIRLQKVYFGKKVKGEKRKEKSEKRKGKGEKGRKKRGVRI
jgi:hypothetical protein